MNRRQKKKLATQLHGPYDFRKKISERPSSKKEIRTRKDLRWFNNFFFNGDIEVSIQGSSLQYCFPQETTQVYAYESMEVAFFKDGKRAPINKITTNQSIIQSFEERDASCGDTEDFDFRDCLYAYVPVPLIQKLYADLLLHRGLREDILAKIVKKGANSNGIQDWKSVQIRH